MLLQASFLAPSPPPISVSCMKHAPSRSPSSENLDDPNNPTNPNSPYEI